MCTSATRRAWSTTGARRSANGRPPSGKTRRPASGETFSGGGGGQGGKGQRLARTRRGRRAPRGRSRRRARAYCPQEGGGRGPPPRMAGRGKRGEGPAPKRGPGFEESRPFS